MNWDLVFLLTGLMLFTHWFNYLMGSPMEDNADKIRPREILFGFPFWLAKKRLKKLGMWHDLRADKIRELSMTSDLQTRHALKYDHRVDLYMAGREFFTWEKSLLCPICFHWWLTVVVGVFMIIFSQVDILMAAFLYLINHFIIRKIS